jgi:hypothetical protein
VRKAFFALLVLLAAFALAPSERQMIKAFQKSVPHPELKGYLERRLAERGDSAS